MSDNSIIIFFCAIGGFAAFILFLHAYISAIYYAVGGDDEKETTPPEQTDEAG